MCVICLRSACSLGIGAPLETPDDTDIGTEIGAGIDTLPGLGPAPAPTSANSLSAEAALPPGAADWQALDMGSSWHDYGLPLGGTLTYTVTDSVQDYTSGYYSGANELGGYRPLSEAGAAIVAEAFEMWDAVIAIEMVDPADTPDPADDALRPVLQAGGSTAPATAWAYGPGWWEVSGDAWFNVTESFLSRLEDGPRPYRGTYEGATALHEVGHALGLKHPHEGLAVLDPAYDGLEYTVMSYRSHAGAPLTAYTVQEGSYPQSLMMLDIAMAQAHYGADHATLSGDTVYTFDTATGEMFVDGAGAGAPVGNKVLRTLWDGDGTDLIDLSNYATDLDIDLRPGHGIDLDVGGFAQRALLDWRNDIYAPHHVYMSLLHAGDTRSLIENATGGSGDDRLAGNAAGNLLAGGAGDDVVTGALGADTFVLGAGADMLHDTLAGLDGDRVDDFDAGADRLVVAGVTFGAGALVYDAATGWLAIDADGNGQVEARIDIGAGLGAVAAQGQGGDTVITFAAAPSPPPTPASPVTGRLEAGTVVVDQPDGDTWHSVTFAEAIADARVVMGPLSSEGGQAAVARVRNVTDTGFEFQIDEWDYLDGGHVAETLSWIAGSAGQHVLDSGQTVVFGRIDLDDDTPEAVALEGFAAAPAVFAQVTSAEGRQAVTDRIDAVTLQGFSVRMQEEEASNQRHTAETVDWLAIDYGVGGSGGGTAFEAGLLASVDDGGADVAFAAPVDELVFVADMQTEHGRDPAALRTAHRDANGARVFVDEEQSADAETRHTDEAVAYLALAEGSYDLFAIA